MIEIKKSIGQFVHLHLLGNAVLKGTLIDVGSDLIVIFNGVDFIYLPLNHIDIIDFSNEDDEDIVFPKDVPIGDRDETLSLRKVLNNARGTLSEVYISNDKSLHGYVSNVMNDYFVFTTPVYREVLIPLQHLKRLIPYHQNEKIYDLTDGVFPLKPTTQSYARTFEQQCKKYVNQLVVFDLDNAPHKIGKITKVENAQIECVIARNKTIYLNFNHVKSIHLP
ncbi:DUF2642 domain-containing protein [Terrilactibacillus sp. BCM23-1]|uniref:DUF2642 domain-containing protein n=1 Tax=Terrilactibacillus tamarindi TaxID=2599694 RepID=A0A6N8CMD5_9BACI|nr:DUF2642 domain-containing protein [Terrilactibacillus tamarindi]MTT31199.1 DUF2642 domain-containing protein [Terrilactibacillus tamarindi]